MRTRVPVPRPDHRRKKDEARQRKLTRRGTDGKLEFVLRPRHIDRGPQRKRRHAAQRCMARAPRTPRWHASKNGFAPASGSRSGMSAIIGGCYPAPDARLSVFGWPVAGGRRKTVTIGPLLPDPGPTLCSKVPTRHSRR